MRFKLFHCRYRGYRHADWLVAGALLSMLRWRGNTTFRSVRERIGSAIMDESAAMSMTIEVSIPDEMIPRLEQKARSAGLDREQYVRDLVSRELAGPRTFDEILGGFRDEVAASGISDSELDQLFDSARQDSLTERKSSRSK